MCFGGNYGWWNIIFFACENFLAQLSENVHSQNNVTADKISHFFGISKLFLSLRIYIFLFAPPHLFSHLDPTPTHFLSQPVPPPIPVVLLYNKCVEYFFTILERK